MCCTGLVWSGFRPSDDQNMYGYNIPGNMYLAGALTRLLQLNTLVWQDKDLGEKAAALNEDIRAGIKAHGIVLAPDGSQVYAYEVDGLGHALIDFDDPNVPSLLSMPLLGYDDMDQEVYANTKRRMFTAANSYFYRGKAFEGLGSPHTPRDYIWPLANMVLILSSDNPQEQAHLLRQLLQMQCRNGLMHESVHVDGSPWKCTRPIFEWSNSLFVVVMEQVLGVDCDLPAEEARLEAVAQHEWLSNRGLFRHHDVGSPLMYGLMEAAVKHV